MAEQPSRYDPKVTDEFVRRYSDAKAFGLTHEVLCVLEGALPAQVDPEDERAKETVARIREVYGMVD